MKLFSQFVTEAQTSREQQFYNDIRSRAKKQGASDVDADVIASQAALETGWGRSPSGSWNYFGQKATSREKGTSKGTQEYGGRRMYGTSARFKDYGSLDSSIADRINKWSYKTRGAADVADATRRLQLPGGSKIPGSKEKSHGAYATDPDYVSKISDISRRYGNVQNNTKLAFTPGLNLVKPFEPSKGSLDAPSPTKVLARLKGKSGELDKTTGKFTSRNWSDTEGSRYKAFGGK